MDGRLIKIGARGSRLSVLQTEEALKAIQPVLLPGMHIQSMIFDSPGDRDQDTPLTNPDLPDDFFTRDLDDALRLGECDIAVHSAKDLPRKLPTGLSVAAMLPCLDPGDSIVFRRDLKGPAKVIGTSSARRESIVRNLFPEAGIYNIRGTIDARLAQLDRGDYDAIIVATCALIRLGLSERINEILPGEAAPLQGNLALVVRKDDDPLIRMLLPLDFRRELPVDTASIHRQDVKPTSPEGPTTLFTGLRPDHFAALAPLKPWPMISLTPRPLSERRSAIRKFLPLCQTVLLTSPYVVRLFVQAVLHEWDARALQRLRFLAVGPYTADTMVRTGIFPETTVAGFGGLDALLEGIDPAITGSWFYPHSDAAPLAKRLSALRNKGVEGCTAVFYENRTVKCGPLPEPFERVLFTSPSTVKSYFENYPEEREAKREWLAVGESTLSALRQMGLNGRIINEQG